ncbi:MAG: imidazoleglycerol-phosphate dehydratase HisB [Elusimicrobia bacterium CG_4_10_14_3_um_filter_49_12_50_7]|nr:MAG: imidazoleglycerol-phosphate dehydratase HisB [Elusimicrobia bacterium CG03_land_8_20_14_0_80_50_18]PIX16650.1 MAG: imidazoleglycerol-phosphate dehydratase HisB [Elusimicrobia bacterium CG_4_8_14_3_um_filter_50_9]PIY18332.1 MAG: imidazoleglycerol-phosphate dehydratase HisB [Elusimicrobia bacterium CG_4_10_14_3_um_filter_49_12_50_7]
MRKSQVRRKTKETSVSVDFSSGPAAGNSVKTPEGFLNHMLELFAYHGGFGLVVKASGDTDVDMHHTVEDTGIVLGEAIGKIAAKGKIQRFGSAIIPMDEALALVSLDVSGRPFLEFNVKFADIRKADFDYRLLEDFFRALSVKAGITMHIVSLAGRDNHHICESVFKAFGKALAMALSPSSRKVSSTKGLI